MQWTTTIFYLFLTRAAAATSPPTCIKKDGAAIEECENAGMAPAGSQSLLQRAIRRDQVSVDVLNEDIAHGGGQVSTAPKQQRVQRTALQIERDLSSFHGSYYLDIDPDASVEANVNASYDHFVDSVGLTAELDEDESELFRERLVDRLEELLPGDNEAHVDNEEWKKELATALEEEKPVVTSALSNSVNGGDFGWKARTDSELKNMTLADMKELAGYAEPIDGSEDSSLLEREGIISDEEYATSGVPSQYDARDYYTWCEDVIGRVRNQGKCGSCWAFAATTVAGARLCIANGGKFSGHTAFFSAGYLASCASTAMVNPSNGCKGGSPVDAWKWMASHGVPTGGNGQSTCVPYFSGGSSLNHWTSNDLAPSCPSTCQSGYPRWLQEDLFKPSGLATSRWTADFNSARKEIYWYGPIALVFQIYTDLMSYSYGIYRHTTSVTSGGHVTAASGFGPDWILAVNSWGPTWGDKGNIKMHKSAIDSYYLPGVIDMSKDYNIPSVATTATTTHAPFSWPCHPSNTGAKYTWGQYCGWAKEGSGVFVMTGDCNWCSYGWGTGGKKAAIEACESSSGQSCSVFDNKGEQCR